MNTGKLCCATEKSVSAILFGDLQGNYGLHQTWSDIFRNILL